MSEGKEVKLDWTGNESNDEEYTVYRDPNAPKMDYGKDYMELYFEVDEFLGKILAVLHRDGGQYQDTHGNEKATKDALAAYYALIAELDRVKAMSGVYRAALEQIAGHWAPAATIAKEAIDEADRKPEGENETTNHRANH